MIQTDARYQRPLHQPSVSRIAREFDPDVLGSLSVSRRADGSCWVIDGNHRLAAVREMGWGDQNVPCVVYTNLSYEDEARLFAAWQRTRRTLSPLDVFRAEVEANDPKAMELLAVISDYGIRVTFTGQHAPNDLAAISAVKNLIRVSGVQVLRLTLELSRTIWPDDATALQSTPLQGLGHFLMRYRRHENFDQGRVETVMRTMTPGQLVSASQDMRRVMGVSTTTGYARTVLKLFNHRLTAGKSLPEWGSIRLDSKGRPTGESSS